VGFKISLACICFTKLAGENLFRSKDKKIIGGVAAGIADYFSLDPVLVRLIFILITIAGGSGILAYLLLWIAIPEKKGNRLSESNKNNKEQKVQKQEILAGIILIIIGFAFLVQNFVPWIKIGKFWPLVLVFVGIGLLLDKRYN